MLTRSFGPARLLVAVAAALLLVLAPVPAVAADGPSAPRFVTPAGGVLPGSGGGVDVTWTPSTGPAELSGYLIAIDSDPVGGPASTSFPPTATSGSVSVSGYPSGPHRFVLRAVDVAGNWSPPASVDVVLDMEAPAPPTGLKLSTSAAAARIDASWTAPADAVDHYVVELDQNGLSTYTTTGTSWSGTVPQRMHGVRVRAVDPNGNPSAYVEGQILVDLTPPTRPEVVSPRGRVWTQGFVDMVWTRSTDPEAVDIPGYDVRRDGQVVARLSGTAWWDTSPITWTELVPPGLHTYTLTALHPGTQGFSATSGPIEAGRDDTAPSAAVVALQDRRVAPVGTYLVAWTPGQDAESSVTATSVLVDGAVAATAAGTARQATVSLAAGRHLVVVRSANGAGLTTDSAAGSVLAGLVRPTTPVITAPAAGATTGRTVRVRWTAARPSAEATISRYRVSVDGRTVANLPATARSRTVPLAAGARRISVTAYDSVGSVSKPATLTVAAR